MSAYVISAEEALWGFLLVAITMVIHGTGMFLTLRTTEALKERFAPLESFLGGLGVVILASLLIIVTNVLEVTVWVSFFMLQDAQPNHSVAMYNALLNYTTLQAGYLPQRWHLLEALLGMAGLLTVAWSTGILYMLAQDFQDTQLRKRGRQREKHGQVGPELATRRFDRGRSALAPRGVTAAQGLAPLAVRSRRGFVRGPHAAPGRSAPAAWDRRASAWKTRDDPQRFGLGHSPMSRRGPERRTLPMQGGEDCRLTRCWENLHDEFKSSSSRSWLGLRGLFQQDILLLARDMQVHV